MNRREALAALTALPAVARITRAEVKPTDVIVVECDGPVSAKQVDRISATIQPLWPNNKILVCGSEIRLKVVEGGKV